MDIQLVFSIYFGIGALLLAAIVYMVFNRTDTGNTEEEKKQQEEERKGLVQFLHTVMDVKGPAYIAYAFCMVAFGCVVLWLPMIAYGIFKGKQNAN